MAKKAVAAETKPAVREISRMQVKYNTEVVPALMKTFGYKTVMEVPKIAKIVLNMRFGDIKDNSKRTPSRTSKSEKDSRSAPWLRSAATECGTSSTSLSR